MTGTNRILMQGDTSNKAVFRDIGNQGEKPGHEYEVSVGVWHGSTLSSATFCLTVWSRMADLMSETNKDKPTVGFMSHADDFAISSKQADANATWEKTVEVLREIGVRTGEAKLHYSSGGMTLSNTEKNFDVLGTEAAERELENGSRQRHVSGEGKTERISLAGGARRENQRRQHGHEEDRGAMARLRRDQLRERWTLTPGSGTWESLPRWPWSLKKRQDWYAKNFCPATTGRDPSCRRPWADWDSDRLKAQMTSLVLSHRREPQKERIEASVTCKIWRKEEQVMRNLQDEDFRRNGEQRRGTRTERMR